LVARAVRRVRDYRTRGRPPAPAGAALSLSGRQAGRGV